MKKIVLNLSDGKYLRQQGVWRSALLFFLFCLVVEISHDLFFSNGFDPINGYLFFASFYFALTYSVYVIAVFFFKSFNVLVFGFLGLLVAYTGIITGASSTIIEGGNTYMYRGQITEKGYLYFSFSPIVLFALASVFLFVSKVILSRSIVKGDTP